jgi:hypothetical protein
MIIPIVTIANTSRKTPMFPSSCSAMATVIILPFAALYCTEGAGEEGLGEEAAAWGLGDAVAVVLSACDVIFV